ncbi:MAG: hypothetical protein GY937_27510 [bacterium]|nr:hypothetical protein [bacterium]
MSRLRSVVALVRRKSLRTERYSQRDVRACFSKYGAKTKEEIAAVIARELRELAPKLPGKRKPWKSEDERLWIFDAASLALTFFFCESRREEE